MSGPESKQNSLNPMEIARSSAALWQRSKDAGQPVSPKVAVAVQMGTIGQDMVKKALNSLDGVQGIAPDINFVLGGLGPETSKQFQLGIGAILLASIMRSLQDGIVDGWEDGVFVDAYNSRIIGTPMPSIKIEEIRKNSTISRRTPKEETDTIRKEVVRDPSFLGFFDKENERVLPRVVVILLDQQSVFKTSLSMAVPIYREAIKDMK